MSSTQNSSTLLEKTNKHSIWQLLLSLISAICFLALMPMIGLALTWILSVDVSPPVAVLQASMGYILLGAFPILAFAVAAKRKALGVTAAFVAMCHVFFYAPQMQLATSLPEDAKTAPKITLLSHNIRFDNQDPLLEVEEIKRVNADLVFLQEITPIGYEILNEAGAFNDYPYSAIDSRMGARGLAIFSKHPLREASVEPSPGYPQQRAVANINGRDIVLWNVHLLSPVTGQIENWRADHEFLRKKLHAETGDVLVAGDFNSTWSHTPFRKLIDNGYREAANDRGRGYARTWPVDEKLGQRAKGFIRIDHVLTRNNIRPVEIEEAGGSGSDHRAVITRLVLLP